MEAQIYVTRRKGHGGKEGEIRCKVLHFNFLYLYNFRKSVSAFSGQIVQ